MKRGRSRNETRDSYGQEIANMCHSFCDTLSTLQDLMIFILFQPKHKINCLSFILLDTPRQYLAYMHLSNYQAFSEQITE